jgi:hypothetical protein
MRRTLVLSALLLTAAGGISAQTVKARLGGELTGVAGARVSVPVVVNMDSSGGQRLGSYTARVQWPTRVLSFCYYCTLDSIMGTFAPPAVNTDSAYYGVLKLSAAAPLGADGQIVLARLPFTVNFDSAATLDLSFSEMSAAGVPFTNLLPILTATGGQYCPARGRYGDLDRDGLSNSRDALITLSHVVGLPLPPAVTDTTLGDVDASGGVTSRDALIVLSYAVGLAIPGQRVLVYAAGSCATGSPRYVKMLPDTAELVPGQPVLGVMTATDSAGRPVSLTNVTWRSADPTIAFVEGNGVVIGRAPGSTNIIGEAAPGLQAVMRVNVIARRPNWYVNVTALGSPAQLGTAARPYAEPWQAFRYVSEGDTVRVAPGTYLVTGNGELWRGAVVIGGTPGDSTTRPVLRDNRSSSVMWLRGGQRTEVHNVVFDNPYIAVDIEAVGNLVLRDVKIRWPAGSYGYGIYHCGDAAVDTMRVERTLFLGDSASPAGYGIEIYGCVSPRSVGLLEVKDSEFRWIYSALDVYDVDSTHIEGSSFEDLNSGAIYVSNSYDMVYPALTFRRSRIVRAYYEGIYGYAIRRAVIDSSYISARYDGALYLEGDCCGGPYVNVRLRHDTLQLLAPYYYNDWLGVDDADSVRVSDVLVLGRADSSVGLDSYFDNVGWARVSSTRFVNAGYGGYTFRAYDVRRFEVDSVELTACPLSACWGASGVYSSGTYPATTFSVTNTQFTNIAYPLALYQTGAVVDVDNVRIDSAYTAMQFDNVDSVNVTDNVLRKVLYQGIYVADQQGQRGPLVFDNDSITCVAGYYGFNINYARLLADRSVVSGCASYGLIAYSLRPGSMIRRSAFRGASYGLYLSGDSVTLQLDSNAISQNSTGLYTSGNRILARWNNFNANTSQGAYIGTYLTGLVHRFDGNVFQGNTAWSLYSPYDSTDASGNWWGADGVQPPATGANAVYGRVNTTAPLGSQPPVPPPAPPALRPAAPLVAGTPAAPPARAEQPAASRPARAAPSNTWSSDDPVLQARAADRQARQERQLAEREQRRAARAERKAQRRPTTETAPTP